MAEDKPSEKPSSAAGRIRLYDTDLPMVPRRGNLADRRGKPGEISAIQERFCQSYTATYEPTKAAIAAGYRPASATALAHRLLRDPLVKRRIAAIEAERLRRLRFDGDLFMAREMILAQADVTELIETWVPPCRYCWGRNNLYQRTYAEFTEDWDRWMKLPDQSKRGARANLSYGETLVYDRSGGKIPFDERGGDGYDPAQSPNPTCPNCQGRGNEDPESGTIPYIRFRDSRYLSDVGRVLYAGIERGPRGIKQLVQNQDAARSRLMGMLSKFLELRASNNAQTLNQAGLSFQMGLVAEVADTLSDDPTSMSDVRLDALLAQYGIVIDGSEGEGETSDADNGEAPPPGRIA
jgi:hypothetical protein